MYSNEWLQSFPHRRLNQLTGEWVLVSPHRAKRPWQGKTENTEQSMLPAYDAGCYLCPGNERAGGAHNPHYQSVYIFSNDYAALLSESAEIFPPPQSLLQYQMVKGICKVIVFSPRHDLTLAELEKEQLTELVREWISEYKALRVQKDIRYIQIFENKGAIMGCSNPHPHGQIWASDFVPMEIEKEDRQQRNYYENKGRSLLGDYLKTEEEAGVRIVCRNDDFTALVPFWAIWPYETLIIPHRQMQHIDQLSVKEQRAYASILQELAIRYDNLFGISFPYSAGMHQSPVNSIERHWWHWHHHFYPPLLRSATVKKFMVGYEMLAEAQRDITPEQAAAKLRNCSTQHYKKTILCN